MTYQTEVLADSPFCYFPLGEAAAPPVDQMGIVTPVSYAGFTFGVAGIGDQATAVSLPGTSGGSGLRLPQASFGASLSAFTVEVLAQMDTYTNADRLLWFTSAIQFSQTGTNTISVTVGGTTVVSSYTVPDPTGIHHWAVTYDGANAKAFDNGVQIGSVAKTGTITPTADFTVGNETGATNRVLDGQLAGFAYYTSALSQSRLLAHAVAAGVVESATLAGTAAISSTGVVGKVATATRSGTAGITPTGVVAKFATAALAGTDSIVASSNSGAKTASSSLAGVGAIGASGVVGLAASASLAGTEAITSTRTLGKRASATLAGTDSIGANGGVTFDIAGTGIELEIYKYTDYDTIYGILPFRKAPNALNEMKGVGGGSFTISRNDPKVLADPTLLDGRNLCKVRIDGKAVAAFLIGDKESIIVGQGERAEIAWKLAGSGLKIWFDDARIEPFGGIKQTSGSTRYFNFASEQGSWYKPADWINPFVFSTVGSQTHYPMPSKWPEAAKGASWIWGSAYASTMPYGNVYFRYTINIPSDGRYAIYTAVDDVYQLYIDGEQIAKSSEKSTSWRETSRVEVDLTAGNHIIAYLAYNLNATGYNGPAALAMAISKITGPDTESFIGQSQASGWKVLPYPATPPGWSPGEVLSDLIAEAVARGVLPLGYLTKTFTDTVDSAGNAWPASMYGEWSFKVGESLLSVVNKLEEASVDIWIDPETLALNMVPTRGTDRTIFKTDGSGFVIESPVEFKLGKHVRQATTQSKSKIKNDLLLKTIEGWATKSSSTSVSKYGRLEATLDTNASSDLASAIADIIFAQRAQEEEGASYDLIFNEYVPFEHFDIGDWVLAPNDQGDSVPRRVMSISLTESNSGKVLYTIEFDTIFRNNEDRINRVLDKLGGGGVGSSYSNVQGSTPGVGQPVVIPPPTTPPALIPMAPTGFAVTYNIGEWSADGTTPYGRLILDWNDVTQNTDLTATTPQYYQVWGWRNGSTNYIDFGVTTASTLDIKNYFIPGDQWLFQVRAVNPDGKYSAWTSTSSTTVAPPNSTLLNPSTPTLSTDLGLLIATWDGLMSDGNVPPKYFRYVFAEVGTSATGPWSTRGQALTKAGQISIPNETLGAQRWVRLRAVDGLGNITTGSTVAGPITITGVALGDLDASIGAAIDAAEEAARAAAEQSNMLSDYGFELNTNEFWTLGSGVTNVTTLPRTGTRHLRMPATTTARYGATYNRVIPCQPGDTFYFRIYIDPQTTVPDDGLTLRILSGATTALGTTTEIEGSGELAGAGYNMVSGSWTVPAGINYFKPAIWIADTNNTSIYFVDDARMLKMAGGVDIVSGSVTADKIAAASIVAEHLQANSVSADKIQANAITGDKIAANTITGDKIVANSIDTNHVKAGAIQTNHLSPAVGNELNIDGNVTIVAQGSRIDGVETDIQGTQDDLAEMQLYYSFGPTGAVISKPGSIFATRIDNDSIDMLENGNVISYWNSGTMYVNQLVGEKVTLGNHQIEKFGTGTVVRSLG